MTSRFGRIPGAWLELLILAAWTIWVTGAYLDFNPEVVPAGREFGSTIQTHHLWENVKACGWCGFWNGSARGGVPAFADVHGSMLHPVVIAATLIWGVVNGSKAALVISFWLAGFAQWWLAKELKLSWLPRMWSALLVVAAGHLAGRMELGAINVVIATAACSLVFPAVLAVHRGRRNSVVLLALAAAGAILGGSGYIQVGLLATLPAFALLVLDDDLKLKPVWKDYARAGLLSILLAAVFLVPFLHFSPHFLKEVDPDFRVVQPLQYLALNLLIDDPGFYTTEALGKFPYPHLYTMFIGWAAVLLAVVGVTAGGKKRRIVVGFLAAVALLELLVGSAVGLRWLVEHFPGVAGVRHPPQIAGLAVPAILGLAAVGLEQVLKLDWPSLRLEPARGGEGKALQAHWLLVIPLLFTLLDARKFSVNWIIVETRGQAIYQLLDGLRTRGLEWVNPPFGEHFYIEPAVAMGLKLSPGVMSWRWEGREYPIASIEANRSGPPPGPVVQVNLLDGIPIYQRTDQPYAAVYSDGAVSAICLANGRAGWIDVHCTSETPGVLIVKENMWGGWRAWRDETGRVALLDDLWLEVEAPAGEHVYYFRYLPWDVPVGIGLSVFGLILCISIWRKDDRSQ